jgi:PAS domain S-box-containing protein
MASNGKIIMANSAACKLLGYSKKELLTQSRSTIFDIKESSFKKMLKQRTAEGQSKALVTAIKKSGKTITCEITSAIFMDVDGIEKAIASIADMSQSILKQKNIDVKKEKTVADNIILAQAKSDARLAENNEWIKYIARASYDVMWDWDIATGEIYTGDSIEEVFGYKVQNNTVNFTDFLNCLLPEEKDTVEKKLRKALASRNKSWTDSFMFTGHDGSVAATMSRASIVRNEKGKAIRLIGAIQDVSRLQDVEKKLQEQITIHGEDMEKFLLAAKLSFDVIWDWDLLSNEVFRGEGYKELFGYILENNKGHIDDWRNCIYPDDKEAVEKGLQHAIASSSVKWEQAYRFICADGSVAKVFDRASILRHTDGKAYRMIGAMKDISRQTELEEKLDNEIAANEKLHTENIENFKFISNTTDDILHHLAFDNAAQANVISTVSSGKILKVNNAACKLLGYSKKELLTKSRADIFDINKSSFKKMLKQRTAEGKSTAMVTFIKKNGKPIACEITSAVFTDKDGIEKSITSIVDMSQSILKQKNIDAGKEKIIADNIILAKAKSDEENLGNKIAAQTAYEKSFKLIFNSSSDILCDDDLVTNQVILSDAYEKQFGYKITGNTTSMEDLFSHIHPGDKEAFQQDYQRMLASEDTEWKYNFRFLKADGSVAYILTSGTVLRNANGKAIRRIGYMQDISKQTLLEEKLKLEFASKAADKENFRLLFNSSPDVLFDIDVEKQEVIFSAAYEKAFGYKITGKMTPDKDWASHIHPDDKEKVLQGYLKRMASDDTEWNYQYRFIRSDHSVANILSTGIILRNAGGKIYRLLGMMHDISKESQLEEKLAQDIKLKEKQIADATEDAKEAERSAIGKELHDNVNQLLGASRMFLEMAKRGGENSAMYLNRSSEYTLSAIDEIRKLTKGLATDYIKNLGLCEAIDNIARDTMEGNPIHVSCVLNSFIENSINDKFKLNIYRIVQEQLNNVLKHAKATKATISLLQNKKSILLYIADNGVGFDPGKKRKGIGIANIKSRAASYHGDADFVSQPGQGCILTVKFPLRDQLLNKN